MRRVGFPRAAGVVVAAVVLSGCTTTVTGTATVAGGSTGRPTGGAQASEQPSEEVPQPAQLTAAALQLGDLPSGWSDDGGSGPDAEILRSVSRCLGARISWTDTAELGDSSSFVDADHDQVGSFAASFHAQQDVDGDAALLRDSRTPACLGRAFDDEIDQTSTPGGATFGSAHFTVVAGSGGGPANVAGTGFGTVPLTTTSGASTTVHVQFVLITGRLTEAQLFFLSVGEPLPAGLRANAIAAVAQRVAAL